MGSEGEMELKYNIQEAGAVVTLSSNILGSPADSKLFESRINELLIKGIKNIVLDLSQVRRINSTGLAMLITGFTLLSNSGGSFALANLNDFIIGALTITKLNNVIQYYSSVDEAFAK